jgi:hypothetical protein
MNNIIKISLLALTATTGFLLNIQPAKAHYPRFYDYYPFYDTYPGRYCYPYTRWLVNEDPAYHPHAYSDGYRQGKKSAEKGKKFKPRTAGGEFARGFEDGYYGRQFTGQKHIVPNTYRPYISTDCSWF